MSASIPSASEAPINVTKNAPALELTEAEQAIVKKWMKLYKEADKTERYNLLKGKILPRLFPLNKDLSPNAWKFRKSVSTTSLLVLLM